MRRSLCAMCIALSAVAAVPQPAPANQDRFREAVQQFQAKHFSQALTAFKQLIEAEPANPAYRKFASEAALNIGDNAFVTATLLPVIATTPTDWQAHVLLARAYAASSTEPGHAQKRDEEVAVATRLQNAPDLPPAQHTRDFLLEVVHQDGKTIQFCPAFAPWGPYNVHLIARVFDASGQPGLRVTLESNDMEQPLFAREHPREAAAGQRSFSLDGYAPDQKTPDGHTIQTHYTFALLVGEPKYDDLRQRILDIASGKTKALSSRSGPVD